MCRSHHKLPCVTLLALVLVASGWQGVARAAEPGAAPRKSDRVELFRLEDLQPGMRGVGYTVLEGNAIEEFGVEILGIMKNAMSPKRDIVFVKLVGERVESIGVASGMSGSPVYIDGKLLGALSYRFGFFSKEPLGGVTPISYMLQLEGGPQSAPAPGGVPGGVPLADAATSSGAVHSPATWAESYRQFVISRNEAPFDPAAGILRARAPSGIGAGESAMERIGTPISLGGCGESVWSSAASFFSALGFTPVRGTGAVSTGAGSEASAAVLQPGSAVGVQLIRGDMDMTATGTVTHVDGDRVYAFGHQFFNFGNISLPMTHATIIRTLASAAGSFKVAAVGDVAGCFTQDRTAGVLGRVGKEASMVPVTITFADGAGAPIKYDYQIAADPVLAPILLNYSLQNVFSAADKGFGEKTLRVLGAIRIEGQPDVAVQNFFSGQAAYNFASSYVAAFLNLIYANQFSMPKVSSVDLKIQASDQVKIAAIDSVVATSYTLTPGDKFLLKIGLHPRRGDPITVEQEIEVPADAPIGMASVYVGDAQTLSKRNAATLGFEPRSMSEVISLLNGIRKDNCLYAELSSQEPGLVVNGRALAGLPGSGLSILTVDQGALKAPVQLVTLVEKEIETEYTISGSRVLQVRIVPRPS